jgi:hypothetical protein
MAKTDFNISLYKTQSTAEDEQQFVGMVKEFGGLYIIKRPVSQNEVIEFAKHLIAKSFKRGICIDSAEKCKNFLISS